MALSSGVRLGPYEIQDAVGAGGMGEVYRARDTRLERTVAIKILPAHLCSSPELKARFEREARAVSSLNHPHICHLYDVGEQDGAAYLVMEYLEGESLADRLRKGPVPFKQALEFAVQITDALAAAHRAGILHRDLKPGNVMLTATGAKLLDFGLAKQSPLLTGTAAAVSGMTPSTPTMTLAQLSSPSKDLTQRGTVVGTFQYMAPEVLQGAEADGRSDVFSLGCLLHEMVTGRRAFEGKTQLSVLTAILEKEPEPVSQVQGISPPAFDHLVKTCLEKNPEERFQTALDVKLQLKWIAERGPQPLPAARRQRNMRYWLATAAILAAAVAITAAYFMFTARPGAVVRSSILPPSGTTFVTMAPAAGPPALSPDAARITFSARDEQGKALLYVRALDSLTPEPLAGTDDASYPFWSPDSREIGFFAEGKLKKIDANGGPPEILCDAPIGRGGAWSKEGVIVFAPGPSNALLRVPAGGGSAEPATKLQPARAENSHRWPQFLPDGRHFLFWARSSHGAQEHTLQVGTLDSLDAKPLVKSELIGLYTTGHLLFMRNQTLMAQPFNARTLQLSGMAAPVAEHIAVNSTSYRPVFSVSDGGTLVYQSGGLQGGWKLLWFTREGKPTGSLGALDRYLDPAISPDGTRVAATLLTSQGTGDIWIFDLARGTRARLTFGASIHRYPVWSPDGKTLYYGSNEKGAFHIYAKATDGSGSEQTIREDEDEFELFKSISPDPQYLVYMRVATGRNAGADIHAMPLFGDRKPFPVVQNSFSNRSPAISPRGKWMAYESNESGRFEVYVTAFPGGGAKWQVSTNGGSFPQWRRDGKELFFVDHADNMMSLTVETQDNTVRLGTPQALFHALGLQNEQGPYSVTADGKKFLINSGELKEESQPFTIVQNWTAALKK
jgi:eukaryotic-like serine/threonine-protein kinase